MNVTVIDTLELQNLLTAGDCKIFDCRFNLADTRWGESAFAAGHIPSAHYLHLDRDLSSPITPASGRHPLPDPARLAKTFAAAGVNPGTQVVVYDDAGGAIAARAWWLLRWLGHDAVAVLNGGLPAWLEAGGMLEQTTPGATGGDFVARVQPDYYLETQQLLGRHPWQLVDARAGERFRGEVEPLDPVAGHIPGALNRPLTDNLQASGRFKPAEQLRAEWLALLNQRAASDIVHMCGSGVTACHNLLAMEHAGLKGSRLYAGSWSEWIRDDTRPVAGA